MPNFGYETAGGSTQDVAGVICGTPGTPASAGTVESVSVYAADGTNNVPCAVALYLSSTDALVGNASGESAPFSGTPSWQTFSWSGPSVTAVEYLVSFWPDESAGSISIYYNDSGAEGHNRYNGDIGTWPNPITWFNSVLSNKYSIFATYAEAGGGTTNTGWYSSNGGWT